jgi:hypothetical protein
VRPGGFTNLSFWTVGFVFLAVTSKSQFIAMEHCPTYSGERRNTMAGLVSDVFVQVGFGRAICYRAIPSLHADRQKNRTHQDEICRDWIFSCFAFLAESTQPPLMRLE